jgi:hypothetical protein
MYAEKESHKPHRGTEEKIRKQNLVSPVNSERPLRI